VQREIHYVLYGLPHFCVGFCGFKVVAELVRRRWVFTQKLRLALLTVEAFLPLNACVMGEAQQINCEKRFTVSVLWRNFMASLVVVRDIMSKDVQVVRPDTTAQEVVATLSKFDIGSVLVVQGERPVGIITLRDILSKVVVQCLAPKALTARQIMSSPLVTISESATVEEAARLMSQKKVKTLPVMDDDKLVGVLTFTDIVFEVPNMLSVLESLCRTPQ
jgi:CBS domain-containing protein